MSPMAVERLTVANGDFKDCGYLVFNFEISAPGTHVETVRIADTVTTSGYCGIRQFGISGDGDYVDDFDVSLRMLGRDTGPNECHPNIFIGSGARVSNIRVHDGEWHAQGSAFDVRHVDGFVFDHNEVHAYYVGCQDQDSMGEAEKSKVAVFKNWGMGSPGKGSHKRVLSPSSSVEGFEGHVPAWANRLNASGTAFDQPVSS